MPFLPTDAGVDLWLLTNINAFVSGTTPAVDTETLSSWEDSIALKSFVQATAANRPLFCELEGVNAVRFAGTNRLHSLTYTNKVLGATASFTLSVAVRIPNINTIASVIYAEANSADTSDLLQITCFTNGVARCQMRDSNDAIATADSTTRIDDNKLHIVTMHYASGRLKCYVDGVLEGDVSASGVSAWTSATFNRTTLGARVSTTTILHLACDIFEVVGYTPALDDATLALHNAYLVDKYATTVPATDLCGNASGQPLYTSPIYRDGKTYIGSFNFNKSPQITVIDHTVVPATKKTYVVDNNIGEDFHDSCAIAFAKTGHIMAFYGEHDGTTLWMRKSTNVADPSSWGTAVDIGPGSRHSYPQAVTTTEGANSHRVYVFYRDSLHGNWSYRYTDNDGTTWQTAAILWQPQGDTAVQIYGCVYKCSDGNLHFAMTSDDVEPGPAGGADLYHWMYKPSDGKWYKSNGVTEITSLPFDTTDATKVYDSGDNGIRNPSNKQDILVANGMIYIAIGTSDRTGATTEGRLVRAYFNGSWNIEEAADVPNSWPYPSFSNDGPDSIYYTRVVSGAVQLYRAVLRGVLWVVEPLTSGNHFSDAAWGTLRVREAVGTDIDVVYFWGKRNADNYAYGQLFGYPAAGRKLRRVQHTHRLRMTA